MVITSDSAENTKRFAASVAEQFRNHGGVIALMGDLGAGKTTFTQGFAQGLGITDKIISPTYVLIRQHQLPDSDRTLYHIDLYRLEKVDPNELGLTDLFQQPNDIILIEWAEKLDDKLPKGTTIIKFKHTSDNAREISLNTT